MSAATYDLHTHTLWSDGTLSPADLVARAQASGVAVLALTDHDVTGGIAEGYAAATQAGVRLIPGVEISVTWQGETVHVLGLCIRPEHEPLQQGLARLREFRDWRAEEIGRRLRKKNIEGAYDYARGIARGPIISRTHFARFLVARGYVSTMGQAFKQYLARGRAAHVPEQWAKLDEVVGWVRGAGGLAVIAHPTRYPFGYGKLRRLLQEFKESGGAGVEVSSGMQRPGDGETIARLAVELDLLGSAGSDFHGPEQQWLEVGKLAPVAPPVVPVWTAFAPEYREVSTR
ncbi:MAG: PHP domain-containing protein [Sulfurifustis sp.]